MGLRPSSGEFFKIIIIIIIIIIMICHDVLHLSRGSHVKSDNAHKLINPTETE